MSKNVFQDLAEKEQLLAIEREIELKKALSSSDPNAVYRARTYLQSIEKRDEVQQKSILVDPLQLTTSFGYKDKPFTLSYDVLRAMAKTHVIKAIIETRKDQVMAYCEPQSDKFSTGFVIQKRDQTLDPKTGKKKEVSKSEQKKIDYLTQFVLNCGTTENRWHADTFDVFVGKIVQDSLTLDQATFEIVRDRAGRPIEFFATDGATYRIADSYVDQTKADPNSIIQGYAPAYVQMYQSKIISTFYPWELCFGVRNPMTDIRYNGYGRAELEDMIQTVTALLNSDFYNANFFKVGSAPKGILRYSGNINQNTVEDFRRQWMAQVSGVMNMHKMPIINADKLDFINTTMSNKDMEFAKYLEFLIKIACAAYKIDPSEIGFPMSGNTEGTSGLGGNNQEEKIKYSKDKGLKPLLKKVQYWINMFLIWPLDNTYEFRFVGLEGTDEQTELDRDVTMLTNFMTLNEIRAKRNLDPLEGGDVPLNPAYLQAKSMDQQQQQAEQQQQEGDSGYDMEEGGNDFGDEGDDNPFAKSLQEDLAIIFSQGL